MEGIQLTEIKQKIPTNKTKITAYLILFILIILFLYSLKKYGQGFLTFFIFVLLLLIPVFIILEDEIIKIFGFKMPEKKKNLNKKNMKKFKGIKVYDKLISKSSKQIITISLIILSIIVSIILIFKQRKLDQTIAVNKRKILLFLILSQLLMINSGTLAMVYLN